MPPSLSSLALVVVPNQHLRAPDLAIIAVYLVAITLFGLRFRKHGPKQDRSLKSYFLASNTIPWWAIALSVVSAETSTLTIISIPGVAFSGNFGFLQVVLGYLVGRIVVAALFLPRYFAGEMLTAYQLIDRRFGPVLHKVTAGLFLLTRAAAEGVRVFAVSIVVGIAIGTGDVLSIAIISALTLLYTFEGGMAAVIWTDVVQMAIYVAGTLIALLTLGHHVPGGWPTIVHTANAAGKFHTFNFALNLTQSYTFWAGLLGGTFLTMASHGTDQLMVQRLLAARNLRQSRLALLSSGVVIFFQFAFFLLIGAGLWVFYGMATPMGAPHLASEMWARTTSPDRLFPTFITHEMPTGTAGLLIAAILAAAMSNLSAALNSLSSTTVVDFYVRLRPAADDRERTLISKSSTALWALVLFAIAVYSIRMGGKGHVVEIGLSIASVAYGCLLGVFLLGTLTRFATQYGAAVGMLCGFALNLWLWQGTFPVHVGPITIPHIAFTWFVLIGAAATFAIGSLASSILLKSTARKRTTAAAATLLLFLLSFPQGICVLHAEAQTPNKNAPGAPNLASATWVSSQEIALPPGSLPRGTRSPSLVTYDFSQVSTLIDSAIAAHKLPGAVVLIGHNGQIVFRHAYGNRKLAGEPGLDGTPTPAEPMTEDTLFDMASLTKCLVTATAIMQLHEQGKLDPDAPLDHYLPDFNPTHDPARTAVTLRLLLTHFSGEPPDVNLKDPWGLAAPDKAEGLHRALTTPLAGTPGTKFVYSDINFILLGALVEHISETELWKYASRNIFGPLGMNETSYRPFTKVCTSSLLQASGHQHELPPLQEIDEDVACGRWAHVDRTAPTAHDDEGTPASNPDFNHLLRGTVHDPTTRRMGGVAGHAGVFSTAQDIALFAQALLDRYAGRPSTFPLKRKTLLEMTIPEQPGHTPFQVGQHFRANAAAIAQQAGAPASRPTGAKAGSQDAQAAAPSPNPLLAPGYPAVKDQPLRGYGWDIDSAYSKPRGRLPLGSFGHTGFTGTSLWMDPNSDSYVILLANAIHPHAGQPISNLRGEVATAAAQALGLDPSSSSSRPEAAGRSQQTPVSTPTHNAQGQCLCTHCEGCPGLSVEPAPELPLNTPPLTNPYLRTGWVAGAPRLASETWAPAERKPPATSFTATLSDQEPSTNANPLPPTLTGLDVLESTHFAPLTHLTPKPDTPLRLGLLTNQTGLDHQGRRTIDILFTDLPRTLPQAHLTTLFSPEHGIFGQQDTEHLNAETDPTTGLHVISLYGAHDADRRPSHDQLKSLDAVLIDLQDAGVRFYTYETVLGYFLEAASAERRDHHHDLAIVVLDRPNPIGGNQIGGPLSDPGTESYINYMPLPARHGLTLGELARYIVATKHLGANLTVVPLQNWRRSEYIADTGLPWTPPSPNLRTPTALTLYPALAFLEMTNLSVGRGTATPFELFGAGKPATGQPWFHAAAVAAALNARQISGVRFEAITTTVAEDSNHYPFHGQTIEAVRVLLTDRNALDTSLLGIELLSTLHKLYPTQFQLERANRLLCSRATLDAIARGDDPRAIVAGWQPALDQFRAARAGSLLH